MRMPTAIPCLSFGLGPDLRWRDGRARHERRSGNEHTRARSAPRSGAQKREAVELLRDCLRHVGRDSRNLRIRQLALEGRHAAAAVQHLLHHRRGLLRRRARGRVRAAVTALARRAVARRTVPAKTTLPAAAVAVLAGATTCLRRRLLGFAGVLDPGARAGRRGSLSWPSSEKSQRLSPWGEAASALPPA